MDKFHPKQQTNFFTRLFFCWTIPIILKNYKRKFTEDNLYEPLNEYDSKTLGDRLENAWLQENQSSKAPSLLKPLIKVFGLEFFGCGLALLAADIVTSLSHPFCLGRILHLFINNFENIINDQQLYIYVSALIGATLVRTIIFHVANLQISTLGLKVHIACSSLIYSKLLKIEKSTLEKETTGKIVNVLSNDVDRFNTSLLFLHYIWISPIKIFLISCYIFIRHLQHSFIGIGVIIFGVLLQMHLSSHIGSYQKKASSKTDERIRLISNLIHGIKVIKMYAWEKPFIKLVQDARKSEIAEVTKVNCRRIVQITFKLFLPKLAIFTFILTIFLSELQLTPSHIFVIIVVYENLKITLTIFLPRAYINLHEVKISLKRIQDFLSLKEKETKTVKQHKIPGIYTYNLKIRADVSALTPLVREINFTAVKGKVVAFTGKVGSGKSTLFYSILKENTLFEGSLDVRGTLSYASQVPWIFSATIKENILFGSEMNYNRYMQVITVCALEHDLSLLPHGDNTLVGERGVMLSGGQRARINLARAIYRVADIYLLDDPFAAVDTNVASQIFKECIQGFLKDKCVLLITHQVQILENVDLVYHIADGKLYSKHALQQSLTEQTKVKSQQFKTNEIQPEIRKHEFFSNTALDAYKRYCLAGGYFSACVLLSGFLFTQILISFIDYLQLFWVNAEQNLIPQKFFTKVNCLYTYGCCLIILLIVICTGFKIYLKYSSKVSMKLHNEMLKNVVYGTMNFFDSEYSGRILNRFSRDIGTIDEKLSLRIIEVIVSSFVLFGATTIICVLNYWMIIPTIFFLGSIYFVALLFGPTNRNIKLTEAITKSPIYTHVVASIQGLATIRTFGAQKMQKQIFDHYQNRHTTALDLYNAFYNTFAFWTDIICIMYFSFVIMTFPVFPTNQDAGKIGLAVTQILILLGPTQFLMKQWGEIDAEMTSVQRVIQYDETAKEQESKSITPLELWPKQGKISFNSVLMKYSHNTIALKSISFEVDAKSKVGIIGRTGAGKTSLINALFGLYDFEGVVTIDDVDIKSVPLQELRSKIACVPQDPVLFPGTIRKNLDPFDEFNDSQIWSALEEVGLKEAVTSLDGAILEGGANFSVGQRQLFCLVRAMLKNSKIVVLDEATANVDLETSQMIHNVINRLFKGCTVLTIAHRLDTVIESDKILVIDDGTVTAFGEPEKLLPHKHS